MSLFGFNSILKISQACSSSINLQSNCLQAIRFATKKAGGSSRNGRDSIGKRLGVKKLGGNVVQPGSIIIRQRGQKYHFGENTKMGRDHTIYSITNGYVKFTYNKFKKHQVVSVTDVNPNIPKKFENKEVDIEATNV